MPALSENLLRTLGGWRGEGVEVQDPLRPWASRVPWVEEARLPSLPLRCLWSVCKHVLWLRPVLLVFCCVARAGSAG